jgi:pectinesterase
MLQETIMNKLICILVVAFAVSGCTSTTQPAPRTQFVPLPDISVAQDGTGDFTTIMSALASIPKDNKERIIIYIKDGVYKEHVRIDAACVTLVGQSRDKTKIEFALPAFSPDANDKTFGRGTLSYYADDIVIQDMTIDNAVTEVGPHAFAVFGRGDRLVLQNCDVLSKGADTIASWKYKAMGMYYYANLKVTGCVDFVCPRGWAYMKDSELYELKNTAALWHQGVSDPDKKFVLRNCRLGGVKGWQLGRHHYDACFYLLDCTFDPNLRDSPLARTKGDQELQFGEDRHYYYNCHREGGDYEWFKDNLDKAPGSPRPEDITPAWTFGGKWDPESTTPPKMISIKAAAIAGEVKIALTFDEAVTVKGSPSVVLSSGELAHYKSGSGTDTLVFTAPQATSVAPQKLDLTAGAILACKASAKPRFVTETKLLD